MKKLLNAFIVISLLFFLTGCATVFKGTSEKISFKSEPQEAELWVNGKKMGVTPLTLELESKKIYAVEFRKEGYASVAQILTNQLNPGWIILGVLGGVFPVIVDSSTGALYSFDQKNIDATLRKNHSISESLKEK